MNTSISSRPTTPFSTPKKPVAPGSGYRTATKRLRNVLPLTPKLVNSPLRIQPLTTTDVYDGETILNIGNVSTTDSLPRPCLLQILRFVPRANITYESCPFCPLKATITLDESSTITCPKCSTVYSPTETKHRYVLNALIRHQDKLYSVGVFDPLSTQIMGIPASEYYELCRSNGPVFNKILKESTAEALEYAFAGKMVLGMIAQDTKGGHSLTGPCVLVGKEMESDSWVTVWEVLTNEWSNVREEERLDEVDACDSSDEWSQPVVDGASALSSLSFPQNLFGNNSEDEEYDNDAITLAEFLGVNINEQYQKQPQRLSRTKKKPTFDPEEIEKLIDGIDLNDGFDISMRSRASRDSNHRRSRQSRDPLLNDDVLAELFHGIDLNDALDFV